MGVVLRSLPDPQESAGRDFFPRQNPGLQTTLCPKTVGFTVASRAGVDEDAQLGKIANHHLPPHRVADLSLVDSASHPSSAGCGLVVLKSAASQPLYSVPANRIKKCL